jgi:hypothetical protein
MHLSRVVIPAVALLIGMSVVPTARALSGQQGPPAPYGWDAPPRELNDIQRQGFHEGVEAARRDLQMNRHPDMDDHEAFRHPHLPPEQRDAFRDGFRRGYNRAMQHLTGGGGGPEYREAVPPPPPSQWDAFPREFNDVQRRGFHDGLLGARRDFDNHRRPDVNNREEYRHPHLPPELREAYRDGFRRGYDRAMAHLLGRPFQY